MMILYLFKHAGWNTGRTGESAVLERAKGTRGTISVEPPSSTDADPYNTPRIQTKCSAQRSIIEWGVHTSQQMTTLANNKVDRGAGRKVEGRFEMQQAVEDWRED
eukprot:RCo011257